VIIVHFVGLFHSRLPTAELPSVFVHVRRKVDDRWLHTAVMQPGQHHQVLLDWKEEGCRKGQELLRC